jgi:hypothetical protein
VGRFWTNGFAAANCKGKVSMLQVTMLQVTMLQVTWIAPD